MRSLSANRSGLCAGLALAISGCAGPGPATPLTPASVSAPSSAPPPRPAASAPLTAAPWPAWTLITTPSEDEEQLECVRQSNGERFALSRGPDGRVLPVARQAGDAERSRPAPSLPFEPVAGFAGVEGEPKQVVAFDDGYLAVLDRGEFGGGLFWVPRSTRRAARVDPPSAEVVRWIDELAFGTIALGGLCHGDACALRTEVFRLERSPAGRWQLMPLAQFEGCPASVTVEPGREALLVSSCGALYRVTARGAEQLARWSKALIAQDVEVATEGGRAVYYVSFGGVVARFAGAEPSWLAPQTCSRFATAPDGRCSCSAQ